MNIHTKKCNCNDKEIFQLKNGSNKNDVIISPDDLKMADKNIKAKQYKKIFLSN